MNKIRLALAVAAAAAAVYLAFPAARYNFDGVACAIAVELGDHKHLVHGNHLAYAALGYFFFRFLKAVSIPIPALQSLQIFSSLLGAAGIGGFAWLLMECGIAPAIAVAGALGLAFSKIYWIWSLEAQVFPLGAAFLMFAAAEAFRKKPDPIRLGLLQAGAVLGHVGHAMFLPAAVYLLWNGEHSRTPSAAKRKSEQINTVLLYGAVLAGALLASYLLAALWVKPKSLEDVRIWLLGSAALGVDRAFSWHGGYSLDGIVSWIWISFEMAGIGVVGGMALIGAAAWGARVRWKRDRRIVLGALLWLAGYALLFLSWEPYTPDYRITDLAPLWLLACLGVETLRIPLGNRAAAVGIAALIVGAFNLGAEIIPASKPENNPDLQRALWIARATPTNAWIIVDGIDQVYIPYFADRSYVNLRYMLGQPKLLEERIKQLNRLGHEVYIVPEVVPEPWRLWLNSRRLQREGGLGGWNLIKVH